MRIRPALTLCALLAAHALALAAPAAEPVRQLGVYVLPYYQAGDTFAEAPRVAVDPAYDKLLASTKQADIKKARDAIAAHPERVSPQTMMVLAIRLYDVGLRDDALFWYYAGRDRFLTTDAVLDMRSLRLIKVAESIESFVGAIGGAMDGYAYCDLAHHKEREDRAIAWVAKNPYALLGDADLPALQEDRNAALADALARLQQGAARNQDFLMTPEGQAKLADVRQRSQADARFCWK
jgi:hypothetical protein